MPFGFGSTQAIHDDNSHQTSAKRDGAFGLEGLDSSKNPLNFPLGIVMAFGG